MRGLQGTCFALAVFFTGGVQASAEGGDWMDDWIAAARCVGAQDAAIIQAGMLSEGFYGAYERALQAHGEADGGRMAELERAQARTAALRGGLEKQAAVTGRLVSRAAAYFAEQDKTDDRGKDFYDGVLSVIRQGAAAQRLAPLEDEDMPAEELFRWLTDAQAAMMERVRETGTSHSEKCLNLFLHYEDVLAEAEGPDTAR